MTFHLHKPCHTNSLLLLLASLACADLATLRQQVALVTEGFDWEWVLIRINGVEGSLSNVDLFSAVDAQVVVTALDAIEPSVEFDSPISQWASMVEESTDNPEWYVPLDDKMEN